MGNTKLKKGVLPNNQAPITLAEFVYLGDGTNKTLTDNIKENSNLLSDIVSKSINKQCPNCKTYKGVLELSVRGEFITNARNTGANGDFYLYDGKGLLVIDGQEISPGDYVYLEDGWFKPFRVVRNPEHKNTSYDVIIAGGGAGGIGAAYALKDSGLKIALVEKLDKLGGTHLNAGVSLLIASPIGDWYKNICKQAYEEGGMTFLNTSESVQIGEGSTFEKLWRGSQYCCSSYAGSHLNVDPYWFNEKYYKDLSTTIDIYLNTEIKEVISETRKMQGIKTLNKISGIEKNIYAEYFIDCTGDGILCTYGKTEGTDYYLGSDSKDLFNEESIPSGYKGDRYSINTVELCYKTATKNYKVGGLKIPVEDRTKWKTFNNVANNNNFGVTPPLGGAAIDSPSKHTGLSTKTFIDKGYDYTMHEARLRDMAHFYASAGQQVESNPSCFIGGCDLLAIRESNRIKCDEMQTESDLYERITSSNYIEKNTIALCCWYMDIHNDTFNISSWSDRLGVPHGIKYQNIIPSAYDNVLVACRAFGCSHLAASASRLVKSMMSMGYAAGKAIQQATDSWMEDVRNVDVAQLQEDIQIKNQIDELETYFIDKV